MATVWIPPLMRDLTGGAAQVEVRAATVREVIESLDALYPGIGSWLLADGDISPAVNVLVDGELSRLRLFEPVGSCSEIHFVPALAGGAY